MCNRYGYQSPLNRLVDEFSQARIPLKFPTGLPNLEPREHIRPTNNAPVVRPLDRDHPTEGAELVELRWWLIPFFHKRGVKDWKPMCTNARAETVATTATFREAFKRRRCLVPATHYFEWTENPEAPKGPKLMWKFTKAGEEIFCFPGLWDRAETTDGVVESFTIVTCEPGPDCAPFHNRQPVILEKDHWADWLDLTRDPTDLLKAGGAGVIKAERAAA